MPELPDRREPARRGNVPPASEWCGPTWVGHLALRSARFRPIAARKPAVSAREHSCRLVCAARHSAWRRVSRRIELLCWHAVRPRHRTFSIISAIKRVVSRAAECTLPTSNSATNSEQVDQATANPSLRPEHPGRRRPAPTFFSPLSSSYRPLSSILLPLASLVRFGRASSRKALTSRAVRAWG